MDANILILLVTIGLSWIRTTESCDCVPNITVKQKYCSADYAVIARVRDNGYVNGRDRVYKIKIIRAFKSKIHWGLVKQTRVYTPSDLSLCGITLQRNTFVLLAGHFSPSGTKTRTMRIADCELAQTLSSPYYKPPSCGY